MWRHGHPVTGDWTNRGPALYAAGTEITAGSENLALIAQTIDAAVIVTDRNGLITWVNQSFSRITGYGLDEVRGQIPVDCCMESAPIGGRWPG
ncbi:PAS domain-containing protein [Propionivibrio sp.]|uniref:PAS domain-containing protein n=1 Tax=Propionivibrio sp. TaxID=2212460 RepID=UPI00345AD3B2